MDRKGSGIGVGFLAVSGCPEILGVAKALDHLPAFDQEFSSRLGVLAEIGFSFRERSRELLDRRESGGHGLTFSYLPACALPSKPELLERLLVLLPLGVCRKCREILGHQIALIAADKAMATFVSGGCVGGVVDGDHVALGDLCRPR